METLKHGLLYFCLGISVALLDALHVYTDTLSYPKHTWFFKLTKQPYWVPLLFGGSGVLIGFGHRLVVKNTLPKVSKATVVKHMCIFFCCYAASGFLKGRPKTLAAMYMILSLRLIFPRWRKVKGGAKEKINVLFYFLSVFVIGPLVEAGISSTERFQYEKDSRHLYNLVPIWLGPLYLTVALAVSSMDLYLQGHIAKEKST